MKKIAILNCLNANDVCTGMGCLKAFYQRKAAFAIYEGQDAQVLAFLRCSRCSMHNAEDPGMTEKLERLASEGIEAVHIGVCAAKGEEKKVCPYMEEHAAWLEDHGISVVWGTHGFIASKENL